MAYNNIFPATYGQQYYYPPQPAYMPPQSNQNQQSSVSASTQNQGFTGQNNGIIWVQGEAGAKSYLVAPNTTLQLWDSESQTIYLKSADASGMPSMKILDYTIRQDEKHAVPQITQESPQMQNYVTRDELQEFKNKIMKEIEFKKMSIAESKESDIDE